MLQRLVGVVFEYSIASLYWHCISTCIFQLQELTAWLSCMRTRNMGQKERRRNYHGLEIAADGGNDDRTFTSTSLARPLPIVISLSILLLLLLSSFVIVAAPRKPSSPWSLQATGAVMSAKTGPIKEDSSLPSETRKAADKLLGGLLSPDFEETSCRSRYQAALYRKKTPPHVPSAHLVKRLREYESLHKKCAPGTALYSHSIARLKSAGGNRTECNYVVWIPHNGLGNRIITIVSSFLYALLNGKVLLVHVPDDFADLLCEPFPGTSWALPADFPVANLLDLNAGTPQSYGNMLRHNLIGGEAPPPAYAYLHLPWNYGEWDKRFFCDDAQRLLREVPWLLLKSDHYFVPKLFLVEEYGEELRRLFPQRSTTFHHLVRYLVHPTNTVWSRITRYYEAYLARADEMVSIQIRVFDNFPVPFEEMLHQIINCSLSANILPAVASKNSSSTLPAVAGESARVKAVFVTNLHSGFSERIKERYSEQATASGEVVGVYQSSHVGQQRTEERSHNVQALTEIELLSFGDVMITTAWSTFGYVAQGLAGLEPWILLRKTQSSLPCRRAASSEPCFLIPPSPSTCSKKDGERAAGGSARSYVRRCEDEIRGIKIFD